MINFKNKRFLNFKIKLVTIAVSLSLFPAIHSLSQTTIAMETIEENIEIEDEQVQLEYIKNKYFSIKKNSGEYDFEDIEGLMSRQFLLKIYKILSANYFSKLSNSTKFEFVNLNTERVRRLNNVFNFIKKKENFEKLNTLKCSNSKLWDYYVYFMNRVLDKIYNIWGYFKNYIENKKYFDGMTTDGLLQILKNYIYNEDWEYKFDVNDDNKDIDNKIKPILNDEIIEIIKLSEKSLSNVYVDDKQDFPIDILKEVVFRSVLKLLILFDTFLKEYFSQSPKYLQDKKNFDLYFDKSLKFRLDNIYKQFLNDKKNIVENTSKISKIVKEKNKLNVEEDKANENKINIEYSKKKLTPLTEEEKQKLKELKKDLKEKFEKQGSLVLMKQVEFLEEIKRSPKLKEKFLCKLNEFQEYFYNLLFELNDEMFTKLQGLFIDDIKNCTKYEDMDGKSENIHRKFSCLVKLIDYNIRIIKEDKIILDDNVKTDFIATISKIAYKFICELLYKFSYSFFVHNAAHNKELYFEGFSISFIFENFDDKLKRLKDDKLKRLKEFKSQFYKTSSINNKETKEADLANFIHDLETVEKIFEEFYTNVFDIMTDMDICLDRKILDECKVLKDLLQEED